MPRIAMVAGLGMLGVALLLLATGLQVGVDSAIYAAGGRAVLAGEPLYAGALPGLLDLPFIYPPIAAVLFVPLTALPDQLVWAVLACGSMLGIGVVLREFVGPRKVLLPLVFLGALCLEPIWRGVGLGQINILLMTAVVLDALVLRGSRYCGLLTGMAAAIKLTPLIFVLHLALTGRRADAARALSCFTVLSAFGALLLPAESARYWSTILSGGQMRQALAWAGNQSITGLLHRVGHDRMQALAVLLGVLVLAVAVVLIRLLHGAGDPHAALAVTGCCATLISPISWTHHWVWMLPLLGLLAARARRPRNWVPIGLLAVVFTGWSIAIVPSGGAAEQQWNPAQQLLGNSYVLAGLVAGAALALRLLRRRRPDCRPEPVPGPDGTVARTRQQLVPFKEGWCGNRPVQVDEPQGGGGGHSSALADDENAADRRLGGRVSR